MTPITPPGFESAAHWTVDGDETSWTSWAENMAEAPTSSLVQEWISRKRAAGREWALDVGCGPGRAFLPLIGAGYQVIGLDPTAQGLKFSGQKILQARILAYPVQASAARIPLRAASVSFLLAIGVLFHLSLTELTQALREIRRVLRPDGEALLHFLDVEDWRRSLAPEIHPEQAPVPSYRAVVTCFCSRQTIQAWIDSSGLKLVSLELKTNVSEAGEQRNWLVTVQP